MIWPTAIVFSAIFLYMTAAEVIKTWKIATEKEAQAYYRGYKDGRKAGMELLGDQAVVEGEKP